MYRDQINTIVSWTNLRNVKSVGLSFCYSIFYSTWIENRWRLPRYLESNITTGRVQNAISTKQNKMNVNRRRTLTPWPRRVTLTHTYRTQFFARAFNFYHLLSTSSSPLSSFVSGGGARQGNVNRFYTLHDHIKKTPAQDCEGISYRYLSLLLLLLLFQLLDSRRVLIILIQLYSDFRFYFFFSLHLLDSFGCKLALCWSQSES